MLLNQATTVMFVTITFLVTQVSWSVDFSLCRSGHEYHGHNLLKPQMHFFLFQATLVSFQLMILIKSQFWYHLISQVPV